MKQGPSKEISRFGPRAVAKAVSPGAVSMLGAHQSGPAADKPLYRGKVAATAPKNTGYTTHSSGSQGRH